MKIFVVLLCSAVVLVAEGARRSTSTYKKPSFHSKGHGPDPGYSGSPGYGPTHTSSYSPSSSKGSGYGGSSKHHGGYSPYGGGYNFHSFGGKGFGDKPLNELDKLFETVRDILTQVKILSENLESASAHLSVQEKKLNNLIHVVFVQLEEIDIKQNSSITKLKEHLKDLAEDDKSLYIHLHNLKKDNDDNLYHAEYAEKLWSWQQLETLKHQRSIFSLRVDVRDVKNKLFQVKDNEFWAFLKWVQRLDTRLESIKKRETRRMCEVGQVTLKADEGRVDYQFNTWFDTPPQVLYGISGFKFNLKAKDKSVSPFPFHYPPKKEPEALGAIVHVKTTKTGLTVEGVDLSFGSNSAVTLDVSFQACTFGPGARPVEH